jgi:hypothetical protein
MNGYVFRALLLVLLLVAVQLFANGRRPAPSAQHDDSLAYHEHPPTEPLPPTIDPEPFKDKRPAFVSYWIAAQIRDLLYQEPCYCPCNKQAAHKSLLDCFSSRHGYICVTCQKQAIFCYERHNLGDDAKKIRERMAKYEWWEVNLKEYADAWFAAHP